MPKYRLIQGTHYENETKYTTGQVIDSKKDLTIFNHPGSIRFEKVSDDAKDDIPAPVAPTTKSSGALDTLASMSVEELKQMAAEEEIDLGKAKTKNEIIEVISKAYGTA